MILIMKNVNHLIQYVNINIILFLFSNFYFFFSYLVYITQKPKSLISIYDNNPQQNHSSIGIIGRNKRSQAFIKRLILSGFTKPILCDINSTNDSDYLSYETFYEYSPTIILITENLTSNFYDLFPQNRQQLIIDTREVVSKTFSLIPGSYQAFGNLSDWEIENGTERIGVAVEQSSPLNLIKFIYDLKCFSRGIIFFDQFSYNNQQRKSFENCLFPFISTLIIFSICFILSLIEHHTTNFNAMGIYRRASSITASTSITLLGLIYLIKPLLKLIEFLSSIITRTSNKNGKYSLKKKIFSLNE